jgi:tRNA nucleotidyltransferase/poly(A) polymerase
MILSILDFLDLKVYNEIKDLLITINNFSNDWGIVGGIPRDYFIYNKKLKPKEIDILLQDLENKNIVKNIIQYLLINQKDNIYKTVYHEKFLTGNIKFKEYNIDLITARKEKYETIASLPLVFPSDLISDLLRRDITINAILFKKIDFKNEIFYFEVIDIANSIEDIKKKISILYMISP